MYFNYQQDNWTNWLPLAEFAYNNSTHSATKSSPFFTLYGQHPRFLVEHPSFNSSASTYLDNLQTTQEHLQENLKKANKQYKTQADKSRIKAPEFKIGHKVWLDSSNTRTTQPTKKLSEKRLGPFEIIEVISRNAFKLKLPPQWDKVHPVFHVSLREQAHQPFPGKALPPPEPVEIIDHLKWEVS